MGDALGSSVRLRSRPLVVLTGLALLVSACGGGGSTGTPSPDETGEAASDRGTGDPLEVTTSLGKVRGTNSDAEGVRAFLDLPYAAPPTGDNRWKPPQPREPYDGVLDATQPGPSCPQEVGGSTAGFTEIPEADEDCLSLSVWAPEGAKKLPVMFWIHGGGFRAGSAHQPYYVGDQLAAQGAVVVNVNYRLGPFGFLATEELAEESEDGSYGNYGIADQVAALEWVQENAAAFGGDPDNVTIFGESAGGGAVCAHLASPLSEGLFDRGIVQSGGGCNRLQDGEEAKAAGADVLTSLGCEDIACLRDLPTEQVLEADMFGSLVADGVRLDDTGLERAERGGLDGIEVMIGSNAEEAWLFTLEQQEPSDEELRSLFAEYTDDPDALLAIYPAGDYEDNLSRYRDMRTDVGFACPTVTFGERAQNKTYVYNYTFVSDDPRFGMGPTHGIELIHLFGHPEGITGNEPGLEGTDAEVSAAMQAAWVDFATKGKPGRGWKPYAKGGRITLLDAPFELVDEIRGGRCDEVTKLTENAPGPL